jgi:predicted nucleotidyltransferase
VSEPELEPERILGVLRDHGVSFVVVGGFAAVIHGSPHVTFDVDIVPERTDENLDRLSRALDAMHARVWTASEPEGLEFGHDGRSLGEARVWNLVTDHGRLDLTFAPSGTDGYDDLARDAVRVSVLGVDVDVASLADVIRSKEAAGRVKDQLVLPVLRRILDEGGDREA